MKTGNINLEQLKRSKESSAEARMDWLYAAICFARASKKILVEKHSKKK